MLTYFLPEELNLVRLSQIISHPLTVSNIRQEKFFHQYYDTFDWRLFNQNMILAGNGRSLHLSQMGQPGYLHEIETALVPVFAGDLPASELKETLRPVLEMRALLVQAQVTTSTTFFEILGPENEVVSQGQYNETRLSAEENAPLVAGTITLFPVTQDHQFEQLAAALAAQGASIVTSDYLFQQTMLQAGKTPGGYQSKPRLDLNPTQPAAAAVKRILQAEMDTIQINEPYLAQDIDTEFLHEYRVALRRTRSALSQLKGAFPPADSARFRADLKFAGQITNELRDIDVYLLAEETYRNQLPPVLQADIEPFFDYLKQRRTAVFTETFAALASTRYQKIMSDWAALLVNPALPGKATAYGREPIKTVASARIYKRYRRISKYGRRPLESAAEKRYHQLRIECKKLRYLLEFFANLYPEDAIHDIIIQLKKIQTRLGEINDCFIQERYLLHIADTMQTVDVNTPRTYLALGALIALLHEEKGRAQTEFWEIFQGFIATNSRNRFKQLFK